MAKQVNLEKQSVAFFNDAEAWGVEPGFYILEGDRDESDVDVQKVEHATQSDGSLQFDERGRPVQLSTKTTGVVTVQHESRMTPGARVWPSPDGKGFQTTEPDPSEYGDQAIADAAVGGDPSNG